MAQALFAEGDGSTGHQHHLSALILQHRDLFNNRCQASQCQATLISSGHHGTAEFHYNSLGVLQLTSVGKGLAVGTTEGYRDKGDVAPRTNMSNS